MGKANYSATTSLVSITSETCGTDLLKKAQRHDLSQVRRHHQTRKEQVHHAQVNKDSFHDDTDFVAWWTTLLLLQTTKASLGIREATHMDALDDACEIIEEKTGCSSRWSMEIMAPDRKRTSGPMLAVAASQAPSPAILRTPTTLTPSTPQMPSRSPPSSTTCAYTSSAATPLESLIGKV